MTDSDLRSQGCHLQSPDSFDFEDGFRTGYDQYQCQCHCGSHIQSQVSLAFEDAACKESRVRQPGASGFCDRASEFCT